MKITLDRKLKLMLLHWLKDGSIDSEELKQVMGGRLVGGKYDFTGFTDDELETFMQLLDKANKAGKQAEKRKAVESGGLVC